MIRNTPYEDIKALAEFIALKYPEKSTPVEKIALKEGIKIFYDSYEQAFDGMTVCVDENFYIHLNTDRHNKINTTRGRFTIAHELGHYFLDAHRMGLKLGILKPHPSKTNTKQFNLIEREADYFASCLLMPESRYKKDIFQKKFSFELIDYLCKEYQISRTACAFRFADIGNHPIMIVYSEQGAVRWTKTSHDFPYKTLIHDDTVPPNTVMGEYFQRKNESNTYSTEQVWAIDWFKYVTNDDINRKFFEFCLSYKESALSLIWED